MRIVMQPDQGTLGPTGFDFCPGCGYGTVVLELTAAIENAKFDLPPLFVVDIGCVDFMLGHLPGNTVMGPHGRAPALATGLKRSDPKRTVIAIQGDGGFMSVGAAESLHAAVRGESFTVIVLNNGVLADTGGQMAPTTLTGMPTSTSPGGRGLGAGAPIRFLELLSTIAGVAYAERVAIHSVHGIQQVRHAISRALSIQADRTGLGIVEILSACPTHWRIDPEKSWDFMKKEIERIYPVGVLKEPAAATQT
jgi:2-oxoglutarate/2-oxoacid ferredoxin oxidoreductase subunit beta